MEDEMTAMIFRATCFSAAVAMGGLALFAASAAEARRGGGVIERSYVVPGPYRGYSGFVPGTGPRSVYCDYQRIPNRECKVGRDGRERCKIVNWTLKQACYY
jgi:hypothetical protein